MMQTAETIEAVRGLVQAARQAGQTIGLVPTMGALHAGHVSLIEAARLQTDYIVTTIFVNPTQFAVGEDLDYYPRPLEQDLRLCEQAGAALVFHPPVEVMYATDAATFVEVAGFSKLLEGSQRPTHFRGVTTIVTKLFNIIPADVAFFGQKDYQQQLIIKKMVTDLNMPIEIVTCPTVREPDGLAMSSRNVYLSPQERQRGLRLSQALVQVREALESGATDLDALRRQMYNHLTADGGVNVDYTAIADPQTLRELSAPQPEMVALIAARVGKTRLIDNLLIRLPG